MGEGKKETRKNDFGWGGRPKEFSHIATLEERGGIGKKK